MLEDFKKDGVISQLVRRMTQAEEFIRNHKTLNHSESYGWSPFSAKNATRTSNTTFTTTTDLTTFLQSGMKLSFTDTTLKYAYVVSWSAYAAGVMTITISGNTLVGNPSNLYYSNSLLVSKFPTLFTYTPTVGGITGSGSFTFAKYCMIGQMVRVGLLYTLNGSTVSGPVTFSVPITSSSYAAAEAWLQDTGTNTYPGFAALSGTTINIYAKNTSLANEVVAQINSTTPFTWANNDFIAVQMDYFS